MEAKIQTKSFGAKKYKEKTVILPDHCIPHLETHTLEIIEYPILNCMVLFFQTKETPDVDVLTHTIYRPGCHENILDGFKTAFERLNILKGN